MQDFVSILIKSIVKFINLPTKSVFILHNDFIDAAIEYFKQLIPFIQTVPFETRKTEAIGQPSKNLW